jgi:hypothetical protein
VNQDHERLIIDDPDKPITKPVSVGYKTGEDAPLRRNGVKMPKRDVARHAATGTKLEERRPGKISGWRPQRQLDKRFSISQARLDLATKSGELLGHSVWRRRDVLAISTLVMAAAPDGSKDIIPQWHISFANTEVEGKRCSDIECKQALACFGIAGAEEDNHEPGVARHFWMPVDPKRRVDCECKETEKTITEPDGHRWSTPTDDTKCHGCDYEALILRETGVRKPCPIHGKRADDRADAVAYAMQGAWGEAPIVAIAPIHEMQGGVWPDPRDPETRFFERQLATICTRHDSLTGRVCELPAGHPGECIYKEEMLAIAQAEMTARTAEVMEQINRVLEEEPAPGAITFKLLGDPMTGTCSRCGVDLAELARQGETGHVCDEAARARLAMLEP